MNESLAVVPRLAIPREVREFAAQVGVDAYVNAVIELAQRAFPSSVLSVSLGQDSEHETHRYIALDVDAGTLAAAHLLSGQGIWSADISRICPPRYAVYFVLGWR